MKLFIIKLSSYIFVFTAIIGLFYLINNYLLYNWKFLKIDNNKNIMIIGASRSRNAINDKFFKGSVNLSDAGDPLFYSFVKLKAFKKNNQNIDTVLLSLDNRTLNKKLADHFYRPVSLEHKLPNYQNYLTLNDWKILLKINRYSSIKSVLFIPKYSLKLIKEIISNSNHNYHQLNIGGFYKETKLINSKIIKDFISNDSIENYTLSIVEIGNLNRIVKFCKDNDIELIFYNPPLHPVMYNSYEYQEGKVIFDNFLRTIHPNHTYLDFSNQFLPDSCYADLIHLNEKGAILFTKKLNQILD